MPFVRNVHLVVSGKTQVPEWASDRLKVVTHRDIIPEEFLPTFNSTTIEMFLHRIPELDRALPETMAKYGIENLSEIIGGVK